MSIVQTVLGPIEPNLLGRTLTHEHFSLNFEQFYCAPPNELKSYFGRNINLETVGFLRQYPYSSQFNLHYNDDETYDAVKKDVDMFLKLGGGAIVENTSHGLGRNLELMYDISKRTGAYIVAGTGHYVASLQKPETLGMAVEQMTDLYSKEIITGVEIDGKKIVKCGFIGEVGSGWPLHDFEKRALRATGEIQEVLGCGVSLHPGRNKEAPFEIIRLYLEAGGKADKCIMSHVERTLHEVEDILEFAKLGTYIQFDLFGFECGAYQLNPQIDMPSDTDRINRLMALIAEGLEDKILMSQDCHTKHRLTTYGGHGFSHIYTNILPRMHLKGLTVEQAEKITVQNPANWLSFNV